MILNNETTKFKGIGDPEQNNLSGVTWNVIKGEAEIDSDGNLTINEYAEYDEEILVMATVDNPNYGKEFPNYSGNVNTSSETFSDTISVINKYRMPLKSLSIDEGNFNYNGASVQLHATPLPNRSDYAPVTWQIISGNSYARIDADTGILNINTNTSTPSTVVARATSNVNNSIYKDVIMNVQYHAPEQTDVYGEQHSPDQENSVVIRPIAKYGGTYVDFFAYRTPLLKGENREMVDPYSSIDASAQWSLDGVYYNDDNWTDDGWLHPLPPSSDTGDNGSSSNGTQQAPMVLPVNGTENATLYTPGGSPISSMHLYAETEVPQDYANSNEAVYVFTGTTAQSVGPKRTRGVNTRNVHFGTGNERNRLFLDSDITGPQGILIYCKMEKQLDPEDSGSTVVLGKKEYYCEFTYDDTVAPLPGIRVKPNFRMEFEGGAVLTTDSSGNITFDATKDTNRKQCCLQTKEIYLVEPSEPAPSGKHYDFDPTKVKFSHADGNFDSKLCTLSQAPYVRTSFDSNDGLSQETWYINYPITYENNDSTRYYNYNSTLFKNGNSITVSYPRNRMTIVANATILRPKKVMEPVGEDTIIYVYCNGIMKVVTPSRNQNGKINYDSQGEILFEDTEIGTTRDFVLEGGQPNVPLNGVSFSIKNQNGQMVCDTEGNERRGFYTLVRGKTYCYVNPNGSEIRITDKAVGDFHDVVMKVTVLDKEQYVKFRVKYIPPTSTNNNK